MHHKLILVAVAALGVCVGGCAQPGSQVQSAMDSYQQHGGASNVSAPLAAEGGNNWLRLGSMWAGDVDTTTAPAGEATDGDAAAAADPARDYIPWRERRGPAYPGQFCKSLKVDLKEFPATLCDDTKAMIKDPCFIGGMIAAGVAGIAINGTGVDETVARQVAGRGHLNTFWDSVGDVGGNPGTHFAVAGTMYASSLAVNEVKCYETSKTLLNALALNGIITLALKAAVQTESPNGDEVGWPSGHTSSSFTFATVMCEAYGPWVGAPLYAFAGFVGYERIDARNHDFSDVVSGMLIGIAVGHAVARNHEARIFGMDVIPYADAQTGAVGIALAKQF